MCSPKLKSVIIGSNGQQLAILGLSKLVVLLIKRVFYLSFKKTQLLSTITVLASTTVDLYFLHYFHLDSSEVVQLVQFKFKIF